MAGKGKHRVLVMAHAHPNFSTGGGEIAAHSLFHAYQTLPEVESTWFLARTDLGNGATGRISKFKEKEFLWEQNARGWSRTKASHQDSVTTCFADLIRALKPTVVHTHHYIHLGLEYLGVIKQVDPSIKIVMTLHDYLAICQNNGQMVKTISQSLCFTASPQDCRRCFPQQSAEDFWLREHFIKHYFSLVDEFVSPSEFLRQRYCDWGIPPEKIKVIENGQSDTPPLPPRSLVPGETRNRFGYFGQINQFKGLTVLFESIHNLSDVEQKKIILEVHAPNLEGQNLALKTRIKELVDPLIYKGVVRWMGSYHRSELRARMANIDWLVIPSIWWENSPMVIQEAFLCGRPVICSDIGGMKEKIRDGIDGLHVPVGHSSAWAGMLAKVSQYDKQWDRLREQIIKPIHHAACAEKYVHLFD